MTITHMIRTFTRRSSFRLGLAVAAALLLTGPSDRLSLLAQGGNPISIENALTGDVGWDVSGSGDPTIQGFATDISINTGGTVNFKINTTSSNYTIGIYRMGYYGGAGARRVDGDTVGRPPPESARVSGRQWDRIH